MTHKELNVIELRMPESEALLEVARHIVQECIFFGYRHDPPEIDEEGNCVRIVEHNSFYLKDGNLWEVPYQSLLNKFEGLSIEVKYRSPSNLNKMLTAIFTKGKADSTATSGGVAGAQEEESSGVDQTVTKKTEDQEPPVKGLQEKTSAAKPEEQPVLDSGNGDTQRIKVASPEEDQEVAEVQENELSVAGQAVTERSEDGTPGEVVVSEENRVKSDIPNAESSAPDGEQEVAVEGAEIQKEESADADQVAHGKIEDQEQSAGELQGNGTPREVIASGESLETLDDPNVQGTEISEEESVDVVQVAPGASGDQEQPAVASQGNTDLGEAIALEEKQGHPLPLNAGEQPVSEPGNEDSREIEVAIREAISKPEGELTESDFEQVTELELNNKQLTNINALAKLTRLMVLKLGWNNITDVSALAGLTHLKTLNLTWNKLTDVSALSELKQLEHLDLSNNQLTNAGIDRLQEVLPLCFIPPGTQGEAVDPEEPDIEGPHEDGAAREGLETSVEPPQEGDDGLTGLQRAIRLGKLGEFAAENICGETLCKKNSMGFNGLHVAAVVESLGDLPQEYLTEENLLQTTEGNMTAMGGEPLQIPINKGATSLHIAAAYGCLDQVPKSALTAANLNLVDGEGKTCRDYAMESDMFDSYEEIVWDTPAAQPAGELPDEGVAVTDRQGSEAVQGMEAALSGLPSEVAVPDSPSSPPPLPVASVIDNEQAATPGDGEPGSKDSQKIEAAIREAINKSEGELTEVDLEKVEYINLTDKQLTDVSALALKDLGRLTWLYLSGNQLVDVSALGKLRSLTWVDLTGNQVSEVGVRKLQEALPKCEIVLRSEPDPEYGVKVGLGSDKESHLDSKVFDQNDGNHRILDVVVRDTINKPEGELAGEDLRKVEYIVLTGKQLTDVSALTGLNKLVWLYLADNPIDDIRVLERFQQLNWLQISGDQIDDMNMLMKLRDALPNCEIDIVPGKKIVEDRHKIEAAICKELSMPREQFSRINLHKIKQLDLSGHKVRDLSFLIYLPKLEKLDLGDSRKIVDLKPLAVLKRLKKLSLGENQIMDLRPLGELTSLENLCLGKNLISSLNPLRGLKGLKDLELPYEQICTLTPFYSIHRHGNPKLSRGDELDKFGIALPECNIRTSCYGGLTASSITESAAV